MSRMAAILHDLPEGRRGRILALALAVMAVALVWLAVIGPLIGLYAARATRLDLDRETVTRMAHLRDILPHLRQSAARAPQTAPKLIDGSSDAIAGATLQDRLSQIASSSGVEIGSSETLAPIREGAYQRIGLHLTLTAPYAALVQFLAALETASPAMIVESFHLHAPEAEGNAPDSMTCDMGVFAYRRGALPSPASAAGGSAP